MRRLFEGCAYLNIGRNKEIVSFFLNLTVYFLSYENRLLAQLTAGKRKGEVGLVVPAKFTSFTTRTTWASGEI